MKQSKWMFFLLFCLPSFLFGQVDLIGILSVESVQGYEVNLI
jgi:hypothetical protein